MQCCHALFILNVFEFVVCEYLSKRSGFWTYKVGTCVSQYFGHIFNVKYLDLVWFIMKLFLLVLFV